jgi:hypothetical protein
MSANELVWGALKAMGRTAVNDTAYLARAEYSFEAAALKGISGGAVAVAEDAVALAFEAALPVIPIIAIAVVGYELVKYSQKKA